MPPQTTRARLFLGDGTNTYQIFSFAQNRRDASIYISAPALDKIRWLTPAGFDALGRPQLSIEAFAGIEKLSLHGSGIVHLRAAGQHAAIRIPGHYLKSTPAKALGLRHLLTAFLSQPTHVASSLPFSRANDHVIKAERLEPYAFIFWAIPNTRTVTVTIKTAFHTSDLEAVPPSGYGSIPLVFHSVFWFAYRTRHMASWPRVTHAALHDGSWVPLFVGTGEGQCRLEWRSPVLQYSNDEFGISLPAPGLHPESRPPSL
jgi:hypothetical protein